MSLVRTFNTSACAAAFVRTVQLLNAVAPLVRDDVTVRSKGSVGIHSLRCEAAGFERGWHART